MPPKVNVNVISEPSDDSVAYDTIVEASNAMQEEPQLLDSYDTLAPQELLGCSPSEHGARHEASDDAVVVESAKKARPKRYPKTKLLQLEKPHHFVILINSTLLRIAYLFLQHQLT